MLGSDWPHAEGVGDPVGVFERVLPEGFNGGARDKLLRENVRWLLGETA
jgi:hypothetical protein